jgi:hypothetical protein
MDVTARIVAKLLKRMDFPASGPDLDLKWQIAT